MMRPGEAAELLWCVSSQMAAVCTVRETGEWLVPHYPEEFPEEWELDADGPGR
jgi:hypothetical protein